MLTFSGKVPYERIVVHFDFDSFDFGYIHALAVNCVWCLEKK